MVWKISEKKKVTEKEIQQTALYGLLMIVPLAFLAWAIEHLQYTPLEVKHRIVYEQDIQRIRRSLLGLT